MLRFSIKMLPKNLLSKFSQILRVRVSDPKKEYRFVFLLIKNTLTALPFYIGEIPNVKHPNYSCRTFP